MAQETYTSPPAETQLPAIQTADEMIVYGTVPHGSRTEAPNPTLSYDLEYFQRFEPISAGDALKRAPGVSFTSDTLEYDQVQLRGLPAPYAQVQINGQAVTGGGNDRVFFVDRIPAELIDGVEIIRSPSADMSSEAIAGGVNVKLKRAGEFEGGWVRGSAFGVEGDELRGAGSIGHAGRIGEMSYMVSADVQQRRNPKEKIAYIYDDNGDLEEVSTQKDTRDGTDYAFNADFLIPIGDDGTLRLTGFHVITDREETEFTELFENNGGVLDPVEVGTQLEDIDQQNSLVTAEYLKSVGDGGELKLLAGYARFVDDTDTFEQEADFGDPLEFSADERYDVTDQDWFTTVAYTAQIDGDWLLKGGVDARLKTRDSSLQFFDENEDEDDSPANGVFDVEERRIDPYIKSVYEGFDRLTIETGLRYEYTDRDIGVEGGDSFGRSEGQLNPSLHLKYALTDDTNLRFSVARTVLRPSFDQLVPATLIEEPDDDDATVGNPDLDQETAWGFDVGFDRRIGEQGIFGVNLFFRDIKDKIELVGTGNIIDVGGDLYNEFVYQNFGDGIAYGAEFDFSAPLSIMGLDDTTVFANLTLLDSEVTDPVTGDKRRFRDQPDYIYNVGVIQLLPKWNSTMGVSYNKRGASYAYDYAEIEKVEYDGNLEAFFEKRVSDSFVIRLTASNLLDAEKVEYKDAYDPNLNGSYDGTEIETERSGRLFMLSARAAF
jgi:outer membrane receptor for ferrienterochelin and colicins